MKVLITVIFILIIPWGAKATSQEPDIIIWNSDTLELFSTPLELRQDIDSIKSHLFGEKKGEITTACWRGYIAEWEIINNELFLNNIYSCTYSDSIKANMKDLFGKNFINNKVSANWFSGQLIIPQGKCIYYVHDGYESIYEKEILLTVVNGKIEKQKHCDNSKTYKSEFKENKEEIHSFIYSNINWSILPEIKNKSIEVYISFQSGEYPKPDSVRIVKGSENEIFNQEAVRIVNAFPDWEVLYQHGKVKVVSWTIPIVFSEENKEKYAR